VPPLNPGKRKSLKMNPISLQMLKRFFKEVNEASQWLSGEGGAIQSLKKAEISLSKIADIDPNVSSLLDKIREALYSLEDSSSEISPIREILIFLQRG
jgi:DNA repair protein RecN (Recombination protein N)